MQNCSNRKASNEVRVGNVLLSNDVRGVLIAGPCQIESRDHAVRMTDELLKICERLRIPLVYKSSFAKQTEQAFQVPAQSCGRRGIRRAIHRDAPAFGNSTVRWRQYAASR